jgi:hypothetical protein
LNYTKSCRVPVADSKYARWIPVSKSATVQGVPPKVVISLVPALDVNAIGNVVVVPVGIAYSILNSIKPLKLL